MNVYFDTEFTGLIPDTSLISIGMIDENGDKFYAEFTDYNEKLCGDWIRENVLNNLIFKNRLKIPDVLLSERSETVHGSGNYIREKCFKWLSSKSNVQMISDVCHYDMTLLCNLFGGAFELPANVNPVCYDICQDIALYLGDGIINDESMCKAFMQSREDLCVKLNMSLPKGTKHNSLYDAMVIKEIYEGLNKWKDERKS